MTDSDALAQQFLQRFPIAAAWDSSTGFFVANGQNVAMIDPSLSLMVGLDANGNIIGAQGLDGTQYTAAQYISLVSNLYSGNATGVPVSVSGGFSDWVSSAAGNPITWGILGLAFLTIFTKKKK